MKKIPAALFLLTFSLTVNAQVKILFDATKAQTAGNADWIIDADQHNMSWNPNASTSGGNESNAQHLATPAQSNITASTAETYWEGSLSSWGIEMVKLGYTVESLPYTGQITYGSTTNTYDLSHYKVFITDEPNILFTAAEKTAIINFVNNGGGLFIISDHDVSDRNGDGQDSPHILNDLMNNNSVATNPFGFTFDYQNYVETTSNFANLPNDSILHGPQGNPTQMKISNGTTMTLSTASNPTVVPLVYKTGVSNTGNTGVYMCRARYGTGKVVALGDSSPPDDGTGDPNDVLYNGWSGEVNGDHGKIITNATIWLLESNVTTGMENAANETAPFVYPNPSNGKIFISNISAKEISDISIYNFAGQKCFSTCIKNSAQEIDVTNLSAGVYYYELFHNGKLLGRNKIVIE